MKYIRFILPILLFTGSGATAQFAPGVEWERCIPNAQVTSSVKINDSTVAVLYDLFSCTDSTTFGLRTYDRNGNLLLEKFFTPPDSGSLHSFYVAKNQNNNYLITGLLKNPHGNYHLLIVADSAGNIIWEKSFYFDSVATPLYSKLLVSSSSGYLFAGDYWVAGQRDLILVRLTESGDLISEKTIGGSLFETLGDAWVVPQGGFLIAATTNSTDLDVAGNHGQKDIWLVKTGESGVIQWSRCYGDTMNEEAHAMVPVSGGYIIGGISQSKSGMVNNHHGTVDYFDYWIFRIDTIGNLLWSKSFGGTRSDFTEAMSLLEDSSIVITGSAYSVNGDITGAKSSASFDDQWTIKLDVNGNLLWQKSTGGRFDDWSSTSSALSEDELIIAGGTLSPDGDHHESCFTNDCGVIPGGWIVKLNEHCPSYPTSLFSVSQQGKQITMSNESYNAETYVWDFGDGFTSSETSPVHSYALHGNYEVCLTASDTCSGKTTCLSVSTCVDPVMASFSTMHEGTAVNFNDASVNAAKWNWDFGDGNFSELQSPDHDYGAYGSYSVILIVQDSCGHSDTVTANVNTCNGFLASFTHTANFNTISFSDATPGLTESWSWNFGDGNFSADQDPSHTYSAMGSYQVCLIVSNGICGADTTCQSIEVLCPTLAASFTYTTTFNHVQFSDASETATSWNWSFGDGNFSAAQNPVNTYASAGTYEVCLVASDDCSSDTVCQSVIVTCPASAVTFNFMQSGDTVQFYNQSENTVSWVWDFGDGFTSSEENPLHIYDDTGSFLVCLIANDGCAQDTACDTIEVYPDGLSHGSVISFHATLFPNPASGNAGLEIETSYPVVIDLQVMDMNGRELLSIKQQEIHMGKNQIAISLASLPAGVYLVKLISPMGSAILKLSVD